MNYARMATLPVEYHPATMRARLEMGLPGFTNPDRNPILFFNITSQITPLYRNNSGFVIILYTGLTNYRIIMKGEYTKPEIIDLNEETGIGRGDCQNGSGAAGTCRSGNTPVWGCFVGSVPHGA